MNAHVDGMDMRVTEDNRVVKAQDGWLELYLQMYCWKNICMSSISANKCFVTLLIAIGHFLH